MLLSFPLINPCAVAFSPTLIILTQSPMDIRSSNLLDEALGLDSQKESWPLSGKVVVIEDCVETSGAFVLHHLIKRTLSPNNTSNVVIFLAFSYPLSHYDRILRKLGCNLVAQRDNKRFLFFDLRGLQCTDGIEGKTSERGFVDLYGKIQKTISTIQENNRHNVTIMIDDTSLMEVAAYGCSDHVLDFLHYCHTSTSEMGCSLVILDHEDIYSSMEGPTFMLQMEYLADVLIKAQPLSTGLAADVHGQLTVLNRRICNVKGGSKKKIHNFQYKIKENSIEYFYPGSRS